MTGSGGGLPDRVDVVVVGGGVMGLSTAHHLAGKGRSVLLLDSGPFGGGSTCKAAGGVREQFSDAVNIRLAQRSMEVFEGFQRLFGVDIDLHQVGYLFLLDDADDVDDFERAVALQNSLGVGSQMISPAEAARLSPMISTDGLLAAAINMRDGHCTPEGVVQGYAASARRRGATLVSGCAVTGAEVVDGRIRAVLTDRGRVETEQVVCAAGAWSGQVAAMFGVDLPVEPLRRQILTTGPVPGLREDTPMTIDFSTSFYFHNEGRFAEGPGLLIGRSDPDETTGFRLGQDDAWLPGLTAAIERRAPALADVEVRSGWAGLYEMTPDHNGLIGEAADLPGFVYATGFSGHGFLLGPAVGEVVAALVLGDETPVDVSELDVRRFAAASAPQPEKHVV